MSSIDLKALSQRAGEVAKSQHLPTPKARAFMITFNNPRYVDLLLEQVSIEDPIVMTDINSGVIGGFAHNPEVLQHILHKVDVFKEAFDVELMNALPDQNWLDDYLSMTDFGIEYASEKHHASTRAALKKEMKETLEHRTRRLSYELEIKRQHEVALSSSFTDVVGDISDFLIHNCEGYKSESSVRKTVAAIVKKLESLGSDHLYINRHYTRDITNALEAYSAKYCGDDDREEALIARIALREMSEKSDADKRSLFENEQSESLNLLRKGLPNLTMKGLRELFEDPDAHVHLTKPFSGLDLSGLGSGTFKERMDPNYVRYRIQEQGDNFHEWVANTIASYVYTFIQYRHEEAYRNALIAFAGTDDARSYPAHARNILKASRPRLYQGESLDAGDPSNHHSEVGL